MVSAGIFGLNMVIYDRDSSIILRLKPVKSQTFIFRPKLSFLNENHKNDNRDLLGFSRVFSFVIFRQKWQI